MGKECRDDKDAKQDIPVPLSPSLALTAVSPGCHASSAAPTSLVGEAFREGSRKWLEGVPDVLA